MKGTSARTNAISDEAIARLRSHILQQASHVIAYKGVDGCSMSSVARSAGCSIGMIQHHFQTRDALVLASIAYRSDQATDEWRRISESAPDPIRRIGGLLSFAVEGEESFADSWGFWIQAYSAAPRDEDVRETISAALQVWRSLYVTALETARAAGLIASDLDPQRIATYVVAAADGLAMQTLGGFYGGDIAGMRSTLNGLVAQLLGIDEDALGEHQASTAQQERMPE